MKKLKIGAAYLAAIFFFAAAIIIAVNGGLAPEVITNLIGGTVFYAIGDRIRFGRWFP